MFPETNNKPVIHTIKVADETSVRVNPPTGNQIIINNPESNTVEPEKQSVKQPTIQPTEQSTPQIRIQLNTGKNAATNQEAIRKSVEKITCQTCRKESGRSRFMLEYGASEPNHGRFCPYCGESLSSEPKKIVEEDLWKRYFKTQSKEI